MISPKEKAEDLVHMYDYFNSKIIAKELSLLCIEEVIGEVRDFCDDNFQDDRMIYWRDVKNEIKKLE